MTYANDLPQQENDRLDIMHHMMTIRLGNRLHLAPIGKNLHRVLDLGTGTGIWAIEMGEILHASYINISRLFLAALSLTGADFADRGCLPLHRGTNMSFCHCFFYWEMFDRCRANISSPPRFWAMISVPYSLQCNRFIAFQGTTRDTDSWNQGASKCEV